MKQHLHAAIAPIDLLTREELEATLTKQQALQTRERFRGIDIVRLPPIAVTSSGGTLNLFSGAGGATSDGDGGPQEGDVWLMRRANVVSSAFATDQARYILFRGSTPSDPASGYTNRTVLTSMANNNSQVFLSSVTTPNGGNVPATGVAFQSPYGYPVQVVIAANGATITNVSVNGITVGTAAGTYIVPAYGAISVAYSVATPTWVWTSVNSNVTPQNGQYVGIEYDAPNKGCWFQPGEQLYAQVYGSVSGNTYLLSGEFIRCPAEMKGKIAG